jgi:hypothetical protein
MPARNLRALDVDDLTTLRGQVESELAARRTEIAEQIRRLDEAVTIRRAAGRRRSTRGIKVVWSKN